ncbi:MAG TPA: cadherin-like domain-containing protein, partial [Actinomycetota bacterium]
MRGTRRLLARLVFVSGASAAIVAGAASAATSILGIPPIAGATVSTEPPIYIGSPGPNPLTFSVTNLPLSRIAALEIRRPSSQWIVGGCAIDPPLPGWSATLTSSSCRFVSMPTLDDDLGAPPLRPYDNFKVYAGTLPRADDLTGTWMVRASSRHDFLAGSTLNAFPLGPRALDVRAHTFEVTDIRVGTAQTPGSPCPTFDHSGEPGSTVDLVICGTNHANTALTPSGNGLAGSFVIAPGTYSTGSIPAGATNVVLGNRIGAVVTVLQGSDHTLMTKVFAAPNQTSPFTTLTGYKAVFNEPPVASDDAYATDEDVALNVPAPGVLANDTDPDGDPLTAAVVSGPANGTLTLNADGSFTYTPAANFNGSDSFTYVANDGTEDSNVATVSLTVNAVNDAPVAVADAYATDEDVALNVPAPGVLANDSDAEGDSLTAALVSGPANGTLTLNADGSFSYAPAVNFNGPDSFTYKANDGTADSNVATVSLTVNAVNDAPVAAADSYS